MSVFISYSHKDRPFVDKIAGQLLVARIPVWLDRWELGVGDSILERIERAITTAGALIVVLSEAALRSAWCRKELTSGLLRELEEREVIVLPVLTESCEIPLFLRDKKYADFRHSFEEGFADLVKTLTRLVTTDRGRVLAKPWDIDWAVDSYYLDGELVLRVTTVSHSSARKDSLLMRILIQFNRDGTRRYKEWEERGISWQARGVILSRLLGLCLEKDLLIRLEDQLPRTWRLALRSTDTTEEYDVEIMCQWLGQATGMDLLVDVGSTLAALVKQLIQHLPARKDQAIGGSSRD